MTSSTEIRVRYAETDAQGVVHHSNHLIWFEEGRSEHLRQCGLNYSDVEAAGFYIVVVEARVQYKAPARYEDLIRVETKIEKMTPKLIRFAYEAYREDGTLAATGETVHLVLDGEGRRTKLPARFVTPLQHPAEEEEVTRK